MILNIHMCITKYLRNLKNKYSLVIITKTKNKQNFRNIFTVVKIF